MNPFLQSGKSYLEDPARLAVLSGRRLTSSEAEPSFDRLTRLAARFLRTPVALVSLVDANRQIFKSCTSLLEPWAGQRETPLSHSFCQHVVTTREPLIIKDARLDPRVMDNPAISDLGVVAYLGFPLSVKEHVIGSFCVIDDKPRSWSSDEIETMRDLAASVVSEIRLRGDRDQITAQQSCLETPNWQMEVYLVTLACELRSPLSGIQVLLASGEAKENHDEILQIIQSQVLRMSRLIDSSYELSCILLGKVDPRREILDLVSVLENAAWIVKPLIDRRGHTLEVTTGREHLRLMADPISIERIFVNLLENAALFTEDNGHIQLSAEPEGGDVVIRVKDSGVGISPEKIAEIFDLFTQLDRSGGMGVGLTVVKKLVELHGGSITVASEGPGKGSEFVVRLPAVE